MKILISGSSSGLGKYLLEVFKGIAYNRKTSDDRQQALIKSGVDVIIHAAFNPSQKVNSSNLYAYVNDNVLLTQGLLHIPHHKFIFLSTVDVYPKDNKKHSEEEVIDTTTVDGIYPLTKLTSESFVENLSANYLILRCTSLLGKYARKNSLIKVVGEKSPVLTLSSESSFNYILYSEVYTFIKLAIKKDIQGIYNLASSKNIHLSELVSLFRKKVKYGNYLYNAGIVDNSKASTILPSFNKSSLKAVKQFLSTF